MKTTTIKESQSLLELSTANNFGFGQWVQTSGTASTLILIYELIVQTDDVVEEQAGDLVTTYGNQAALLVELAVSGVSQQADLSFKGIAAATEVSNAQAQFMVRAHGVSDDVVRHLPDTGVIGKEYSTDEYFALMSGLREAKQQLAADLTAGKFEKSRRADRVLESPTEQLEDARSVHYAVSRLRWSLTLDIALRHKPDGIDDELVRHTYGHFWRNDKPLLAPPLKVRKRAKRWLEV